jgi:hypothetical protein
MTIITPGPNLQVIKSDQSATIHKTQKAGFESLTSRLRRHGNAG